MEEETTYSLSFPDGRPVHIGELQEWLNEVRADPDVSDEEFVLAASIIRQIRAKLN